MGWGACLEQESPRDRRRRVAERRAELERQRACYRAWLQHYERLGLGWIRATEHARKRAARGTMPK